MMAGSQQRLYPAPNRTLWPGSSLAYRPALAAPSPPCPLQADNFYYPPGWDPSKGSLNKFNNSHGALGDRGRKLASDGILVIRFEMPFNVWCAGCNHLIGKVRAAAVATRGGLLLPCLRRAFSLPRPALPTQHCAPRSPLDCAAGRAVQCGEEAGGAVPLHPHLELPHEDALLPGHDRGADRPQERRVCHRVGGAQVRRLAGWLQGLRDGRAASREGRQGLRSMRVHALLG